MTQATATVVLEVRKLKIQVLDNEPSIEVFRLKLCHSDEHSSGVWSELFGSVDHLDATLKGIVMGLSAAGYGYVIGPLKWPYPSTFGEPSGVRWSLVKDELPRTEELNSDGEVIEQP